MPLVYFDNNVSGTTNLLQLLHRHKCRRVIFSSSATVYGNTPAPINEESTVGVGITNPYGRSKFISEEILKDFSRSPDGETWSITILRYFNPVGAHKSGRIGEDPTGIPNNLMPFVTQVAVGMREQLTIFGDDYPTPDGTGIRDYIHVMDLAEAHHAALTHMTEPGLKAYNIGSGKGHSVMEMVQCFRKVSGKEIPYKIGPRRPGDLASVFADPSKAKKELNFTTTRNLEAMCEDMWRWQQSNPTGYAEPLQAPELTHRLSLVA